VFQKWSQLKCSNALFATLLFFSVNAFAMPKLLEQVEAKYSHSNTLKAEFKQKQFSKITGSTKKFSGKIYVKRPSKVRWETEKPEPNLLIGDGKTYWFYTPPIDKDEKGQVIERSAKTIQSQLADALISGRFSMNRDMQIVQKNPSTFLLVPKLGTAGTVANATVVINPQKELIEKVILDHKGGNRAEIDLSNIELGQELDAKLFQFTAPPNMDQITE